MKPERENKTMSPPAFVESPVLLHMKKKHFLEQKVKYDSMLGLVSGRFTTPQPRSGFRAVISVGMDHV